MPSDRMSQSGQVVARDAQEQAACIQVTSASLEEISATSRENASRAGEADRLMQTARKTVDKASGAMNALTTSMDAISKSSKQVSAVLKSIDETIPDVTAGAQSVSLAHGAFQEVSSTISSGSGRVRQIAVASEEQARAEQCGQCPGHGRVGLGD